MRRSEQEILEIVYRRSGQIRLRRHALQILAGAAATLVLLTAGPTLVRQLGVQKIETADQPKTEQANRDETAGPGGLGIPGGLLGPGAGPGGLLEPLGPGAGPEGLLELLGPGAAPASPGTSPATTMGSSDAQTSGTTGSPPAGSTSQGPAGSLDTTFGTGGKVTTDFGTKGGNGKAMAIQPDGRIVVAGHNGHFACDSGCSADDFPADFALVRYNANGSLDTNFGTGGKVTTDFVGSGSNYDYGEAIALQPDGRIVVAGCSDKVGGACDGTGADFALARYNANGSLDTNFGTGGKVTTDFGGGSNYDYGRAVALQSDGRIVVVGSSSTQAEMQGSPVDFALARYNANGSLDTNFGTGGKVTTDFVGSDYGAAVALQSDGRIVVVGSSSIGPGIVRDFALARYNANGSLDTNFGTGGKVTTDFGGGSDEIKAVAIQSDGRIVVAGRSNGDFVLARYNADGSLDSAFGTGGKVITAMGDSTGVGAMALQFDGRIVVAGRNGGSVDKNDFALVRYNANGSLDSAFGTGGKVTTDFGSGDNANALAIQPDGRIVAAGYTGAPNTHHFAVARYLG